MTSKGGQKVIITKPPHSKFSGSIDSNHFEFFWSFYNFCQSLNYTESEMCTDLLDSLTGEIAFKIHKLPKEVKTDWPALKKAFFDYCESPDRKLIWSTMLEQIKLDPSKGIESYIQEIQSLGERLGLEESTIVGHMVNKLTPPLYTRLVLLGVTSLEEAISKLRLLYMVGVGNPNENEV